MGQQAESRHQLQHHRACKTSSSARTTSIDSAQTSTQIHQWHQRLHNSPAAQASDQNTTRTHTTQHHNFQ
eukprot:1643434-Amphidinium_carterae.1